MISLEHFIIFLETQLLNTLRLESWLFYPHFSTEPTHLTRKQPCWSKFASDFSDNNGICVWWHEEPIYKKNYSDIFHSDFLDFNVTKYGHSYFNGPETIVNDVHMRIFANSEKSLLKKNLLRTNNFYDWYFFFHGFAALNWFSDYKYFDYFQSKFDNVFISLNYNLIGKRSYRLALLSLLKENDLLKFGAISCSQISNDLIKKEIFSSESEISLVYKKMIFKNLLDMEPKILDSCDYPTSSSKIGDVISDTLSNYHLSSFLHVVNETNYYEEKLHLTEKIFKPIVLKRPFVLVAAAGNLSYLKSYGFKTFDKWIDESYDNELDKDLRLYKIFLEIQKLCKLSQSEIQTMYYEMQEILEYNHHHFYTNFKTIIVDELLTNFEICCKQYNLRRSLQYQIPIKEINFDKIKKIMLK